MRVVEGALPASLPGAKYYCRDPGPVVLTLRRKSPSWKSCSTQASAESEEEILEDSLKEEEKLSTVLKAERASLSNVTLILTFHSSASTLKTKLDFKFNLL